MGNQNTHSRPLQPVDIVRQPPPRPKEQPSAHLVSALGPKGPSYNNPENRVLPSFVSNELKSKLRPVSQEISRFNPDIAYVYGYTDEEKIKNSLDELDNIVNSEETDGNKENIDGRIEGKSTNFSDKNGISFMKSPHPVQNGHVPGIDHGQNNSKSSENQNDYVPNGILKRSSSTAESSGGPTSSSSLENTSVHIPRLKSSHQRQLSSASSLRNQENVIFEEPEENIDDRGKIDPLYQSYPGMSLPVKNNFNLDYSYQLTYAQLAEHRRQKTLEELEKKTGKKISDLSADLKENSNQPSFFRGENTRTSSRSTGSSESGVSRKKKRAPPPPQPPPTVPSQRSSSMDCSEPPADYVMESPRYNTNNKAASAITSHYSSNLGRSSSVTKNWSMPSAPPAPPPPPLKKVSSSSAPFALPKRSTSIVTKQFSSDKPEILLKRAPSVQSTKSQQNVGQVPWLLEIKTMAETKSMNRQMAQESANKQTSDASFKRQMSQESATNDIIPPPPAFAEQMESQSPHSSSEPASPRLESSKSPLSSSHHQMNLVFDTLKGSFPNTPRNEKQTTNDSSFKTNSSIPALLPQSSQNFYHEISESTPEANQSLQRHHSTTVTDKPSLSQLRQNSAPGTPSDPVRRLNSLLQHDIKLAAQSKAMKITQHATPVKPKPKDPHEIFKEQLQKAFAAREERIQTEGTIDSKLNSGKKQKESVKEESENIVLETGDIKATSVNNVKGKQEEKLKPPESPTLQPQPGYKKNIVSPRGNIFKEIEEKQRSCSFSDEDSDIGSQKSSTTRNGANEWIPEDDLDSEDNLSDRETVTSRKGSTSEGFKSSIIPGKVDDLKKKKGNRNFKESKTLKKQESMEKQSTSKQNKLGSIKKFKKSVHKSVQNAFGSISKASGKILRRQRSEELETVHDTPRNWRLSAAEPVSNGFAENKHSHNYEIPNGYQDVSDQSDEDDDDAHSLGRKEFGDIIFASMDSLVPDEDDDELRSGDDENGNGHNRERTPRKMKRAGVAYVSAKGQIVVLPDYETVGVNEKEHSIQTGKDKDPKLYDKKKKFKYDATVKRKERQKQEEVNSELLREKEKQMEEERQKQLEAELEIQKIRELETRERLQRLETAQYQQQINAQMQQQQQYSMLTQPPLPPPAGFGNISDLSQSQSFPFMGQTNYPMGSIPMNLGVVYGPQSHVNSPLMNGSLPSMTYDMNDYMRMLNMPVPPVSNQQFAYMLNSVNWNSQPFSVKANSGIIELPMGQTKPFSSQTLPLESKSKTPFLTPWEESLTKVNSSTPRLHPPNGLHGDSSVGEFYSQYMYGADSTNGDVKTEQQNPLYDSSDSEDGLSPVRTMVKAHVKDYREISTKDSVVSSEEKKVTVLNGKTSTMTGVLGPQGYKTVVHYSPKTGSRMKNMADE
ncbi:hypothetical protein CHS0354_040905 [Potamilus streckersoni]|uniref:Uncharacterized protein n=1 Tax=Potamilus streckersoni TaxID=2493646 RepID=A0AAE0VXZ4_9BIVA|nr:hypothetical protein CHS0354_040905 [Potamilus streckersoni]